MDNILCRAVRAGRFAAAATLCVHSGRMADALILAIAGGYVFVCNIVVRAAFMSLYITLVLTGSSPDLLATVQDEYFRRSKTK